MCRLFGFRSIFSSKMHSSLVDADNALMQQSEQHCDGWGVAYYIDNTPHVIKSHLAAINDNLFKKVSGIVQSQTVLAHIRKATHGEVNNLNCHPFQWGRWTFAHNGNLKKFEEKKHELLKHIPEHFQSYILGDTDSEIIFFFLLQKLDLFSRQDIKHEDFRKKFQQAIHDITQIFGEITLDDKEEKHGNFLSFILTNGEQFIVFNGGKVIRYSTYKARCPESSTCSFYAKTCESKHEKNGDTIQHLIVSSEVIENENVWQKLDSGQCLFLDKNMRFFVTDFPL